MFLFVNIKQIFIIYKHVVCIIIFITKSYSWVWRCTMYDIYCTTYNVCPTLTFVSLMYINILEYSETNFSLLGLMWFNDTVRRCYLNIYYIPYSVLYTYTHMYIYIYIYIYINVVSNIIIYIIVVALYKV